MEVPRAGGAGEPGRGGRRGDHRARCRRGGRSWVVVGRWTEDLRGGRVEREAVRYRSGGDVKSVSPVVRERNSGDGAAGSTRVGSVFHSSNRSKKAIASTYLYWQRKASNTSRRR